MNSEDDLEEKFTMKDLSFIAYLKNRDGKCNLSDIEYKTKEELDRLNAALEYYNLNFIPPEKLPKVNWESDETLDKEDKVW